ALPSPSRIVLEITEHDRIDDWPSMHAALAELRAAGVRIAVDDVGVGYAGLQQLHQLLPDFIKMDQYLVRGIDADPARRALATALVQFAEQTGSLVLAEGVETAAELGVLVGTGVHQAQGHYLAPPGPLPLPVGADRVTPAESG
nr:EAL domain-containing protein [Micromonospora sp. DSM 115978]